MDESLRTQLINIAVKAYERGHVGGTGGNISARLSPSEMLITASGVSLGDTNQENIVKVDIGTLEAEFNNGFIPSKEYRFHAAIYRTRPDVNAVVHCHPPYATAYAVRKMDIPYVTDAAFKQPPMVHVAFSPSGSQELVDKVGAAARENPCFKVILLEQHGVITVGKDLVEAYNLLDLTEELAKIAYLSTTIPVS